MGIYFTDSKVGNLRKASHSIKRKFSREVFSNRNRLRVLILSESGSIPESQIFPFHFYAPELFKTYSHELIEVALVDFEQAPDAAAGHADIVMLQTWFDLSAERCEKIFQSIKLCNPAAKIVYLDCFAPTDLRLAEMLDPYIDLYLKKNVFRERGRYGMQTNGDTNLTDFYSKKFGLVHPSKTHIIPTGFLNKLNIGPGFNTSYGLLPNLYDKPTIVGSKQTLNIHTRLTTEGTDWYQLMRLDAVKAIGELPADWCSSSGCIQYRKYIKELNGAKLCFSPFGYGEVCLRDYEAVSCGALLIKPDMSHVETYPDIYRAGETYIPVAWDYSDLIEKVKYYVEHPGAAVKIAENAYKVLHDYSRSAAFVRQVAPLFSR